MRQLLGLLLAIAAMSAMAGWVAAQDTDQRTRFRILVPTEAIVYVAGDRMLSGGADRLFESPPLTVGQSYRYEFKVVWRGKEVVREVSFVAGGTVVVDFRDDFGKAEASEEGQGSPFRRIRPWTPWAVRYC